MLMEPLNKIINEEIMQHKPKQDNNEVRLAVLETSVSHIYQTLERMEKNIERGFDSLNARIGKVEDKLWQHLMWLLGIFGTLIVGFILTIARSFHWFGG
jgi:hypothetical protein